MKEKFAYGCLWILVTVFIAVLLFGCLMGYIALASVIEGGVT